jgi:hypothetical protein
MRALIVAALIATGIGVTAAPAAAAPRPPAGNPCVVAIRAVFAPHGQAVVNRFVAISYRESRHTQSIQNARSMGARWGRAAGCLQILPGVARNLGARCNLLTAWCNATTARTLYRRSGFTPWRVR